MFKSLKRKFHSSISVFVLLLLVSAVLIMSGCGNTAPTTSYPSTSSEAVELGEGEQTFTLLVTDLEEDTKTFHISTDEETVGAALLGVDLIQGENTSFGLMVTTVDGISSNFDVDQTFWAFFIDGEFATQGVDSTVIDTSVVYEFRLQR